MVAINPPFALQNAGATHTAENDRMMLGGLSAGVRAVGSMVGRGGVHPNIGGAFIVTQTGTPSMAVQVSSGIVYVPGSEGAKQGVYACTNDGTVTLNLSAAHGSLARIDSVVARVQDSAYSGAVNSWGLEIVAGIAASSPVEPTLPANSQRIANINVAASDTAITNSEIVDRRTFMTAPGGTIPCKTSDKASLLPLVPEGQGIFLTDSGVLEYKYLGAWTTIAVPQLVTAWQTYPVQWQAATTQPNVGNGVLTGRYKLVGKTCHFMVTLTMGTTTTYGSGNYVFTLPVAGLTNFWQLAHGHIRDSSGANEQPCSSRLSDTSTGRIHIGGSGAWVDQATYAWAAQDMILIGGTYETN